MIKSICLYYCFNFIDATQITNFLKQDTILSFILIVIITTLNKSINQQ